MIKITAKQKPYVTGFAASAVLTLAAYVLVVTTALSGWTLALTIIGLALVQFSVQVIFFLHLGRESKQRWNLTTFLFMMMVVVIVVGGSLWIMANLNYHHDRSMIPAETDKYIIQDEGIQQ